MLHITFVLFYSIFDISSCCIDYDSLNRFNLTDYQL